MTDYGHDLLFGSLFTPAAQPPEQAVLLAQLAEQVGLDLATFQDHPYQPAFLDTWTVLSYVAASTGRIRLAGNVLNLPLRQPVVLARSVASLDLLSGGRVELGLGAGAFWDAIEANGGRRLTPGQSVAALDEAITIIRQVWAADQRGGVRGPGDHYRVAGAKRGPAPAHPVGIWVGGYRPRMLRLVGRAADGWLPSLPYLPNGPAGLVELNANIDEAAAAAGRAPAAVRRLLNISGQFTSSGTGLLTGPPRQWIEELAGLALDHGISGFILMGDDPAVIQVFGLEVAPAVRDLVAAERGGPAAPATPDRSRDEAVTGGGAPITGSGAPIAGTPEPGTRLSDRQVWDESTRPVGPPAPDGHASGDGSHALGRHLVEVHDHLRQELTQLRALLQQVKDGAVTAAEARGGLNQMAIRQNNWTLGAYCDAYCTVLTQHHGIEDRSIFPHLRRSDAGLAPVIDRLEEEHAVIHDLIERVDRALVDIIRTPDDFTSLQQAIDVLTDALLSHLAYEEQQLVEPLSRFGLYAGQV